MKNQQIYNETKSYEERSLHSYKDIYSLCSHDYSNYRYLKKQKEYSLPSSIKYDKCGIIPEMSLLWYAYNYRLSFFRYEINEYEEVCTFTSKVLYADIFKPKEGIFNDKIIFCFLVITESQIIFYGVDKDLFLINTNFVSSISSTPVCYNIANGSIYLGCEDGNVYEVIYNMSWSLKLVSFKTMYLYSPTNSFFSFLRRKKFKIISMSSLSKFLVTLSKNITVYNIEGGIFKVKEISIYKEYIDIQILEEKENNLFFYCVLEDGSRDFFYNKLIFSKKENKALSNDNINGGSNINGSNINCGNINGRSNKCISRDKYFITLNRSKYSTMVNFTSYNIFQNLNLDFAKSAENLESISFSEDILNIFISGNILYLISPCKLIFYEILNIKKYVISSRVEEVYNMLKNLGERESLILYFDLLSLNCDISKLEYLFVKINENHIKALFSFIYREIKEIINTNNLENNDVIINKFKNLINKLKEKHFKNLKEGIFLMEYFNQTVFYINLLKEYSINLKNKTFYDLIFGNEEIFKKESLTELMEIYKTNQNIDLLINLLSNNSPDYLPINEIYYHKGLDLLKKYPSKERLYESLKNFKNVPFKKEIVDKFNELGFYSGSIELIRKKYSENIFDKDYKFIIELIKSSLQCYGAILKGLEDKREEFLYPFLDALLIKLDNNMNFVSNDQSQYFNNTNIKDDNNNKLGNTKSDINDQNQDFNYKSCTCCDIKNDIKLSEIIKINKDFLSKYLQEKSEEDSNELIYELYWKYCAYRNEREKAVENLIYLIENKPISLEKRIDLLQKAKTVSLHTKYQEIIKNKINLKDLQLELIRRGEDSKNIKLMLMSADKLFNDYSYKYPDLSLKIIDQCTFNNRKILEELWNKALEKEDFKNCVEFIIKNKFKGSALDCEILGNILLNKMSKEEKLSKTLFLIGFNYKEVQKFIEHRIKKEEDLEFRNFLVEDFKVSTEDEKYCKKLEKYCIAK